MINRIGDGTYYNLRDVSKANRQISKSSEFSIDYNDLSNSEEDILFSEGESGVELVLSSDNQSSTEEDLANGDSLKNEEIIIDLTFIDSLRQKFFELRDFVLKLVDRIWNGKQLDNGIEDNDIKSVSNLNNIDSKAIKDMTFDEVSEYLSEGGTKILAKNSDVLTTYNQFGKIVEIAPSDRNLIFHGNKSYKDL